MKVGQSILDAGNALGSHPTGRPGRVARYYEKSLTDISYIIQYRFSRRRGADVVLIVDIVHTRRNWRKGEMPPA